VTLSFHYFLLNDSAPYRENIKGVLEQAGLFSDAYYPQNEADFVVLLEKQHPAVILLIEGQANPIFRYEQVQKWLAEQHSAVPVWMIVEAEDEQTAVKAMEKGLADYFFVDRLVRLGPAVGRLIDQSQESLELVDLNQLMEDVVAENQPLFQAQELPLTFLPAVDLPLVLGRPDQLAQALTVILVNILEAAPAGTRTDTRLYLDAVREEACLEIRLSGEGLQTEEQIEETAVTEATLQRPMGLVESQRGRIYVDGGEEFGIRIRVSFPAIVEKQVEGSPNLLVVENSLLMRSILQEALEQEGFTVRTAEHGAAALEMMAEYKPALIISDIMMPIMDGFTFFNTVRENPVWQEIPFIFVTGQSDRKDQLNTQVLRGATYLIKPIVIEELLVAVHSRLQF
jgi:DNA-binding response OmpR family regulator